MDWKTCKECGRRFDYAVQGTHVNNYGYFCCEGHYRDFCRKEEEDAAQEQARREQEALDRYEADLRKERLDAEHREWMENQVIKLDASSLGIPLSEAWGNKGDWNGLKIKSPGYSSKDGEVTIKIGRIQNDAKGPTGTLRITLEYIHSDGSREIAAKFYRDKLAPGYGYPDTEETVDYTKPKNKNRETKPAICVYELNGKGKWARCASYEWESEAEKAREKEAEKKRAAEAKKRAEEDAARRAIEEKKRKREKQADRCLNLLCCSVPAWFALLSARAAFATNDYTFPLLGIIFIILPVAWSIYRLLRDGGFRGYDIGEDILQIGITWGPAVLINLVGSLGNFVGTAIILAVAVALYFALEIFGHKNQVFLLISRIVAGLSVAVAVVGIGAVLLHFSGAKDAIESKLEPVTEAQSKKEAEESNLESDTEGWSEEEAAKQMKKWYTPEADVVVGQEFLMFHPDYSVDRRTGAIEANYEVPFGRNGLAGSNIYSVDTATHTITIGKGKAKKEYRYFPDGSAYYWRFLARPKAGAKFNPDIATEVVGKSFGGPWSDRYTATITFGKDGRATVKFSDGDTASGAYIASDEANMVLYNHKDAGVWYTFTYSDDGNVTFERPYVEEYSKGWFRRSRYINHEDWRRM